MNIEKDIENIDKYIELILDKNYCDCNELNVISNGKYCDGSKNVANSIKNILKEYRNKDKDNNDLVRLYKRTAIKLKENGKEELADFFLAQIGAVPVFTVTDDIDYYAEYHRLQKENKNLKQQIKDLRELNVKHLVKGLNESLQATNKSNEQLNALNDGWKAAIRDKQIQREFELQQKYKDFDKDPEWLRYQELLGGK